MTIHHIDAAEHGFLAVPKAITICGPIYRKLQFITYEVLVTVNGASNSVSFGYSQETVFNCVTLV